MMETKEKPAPAPDFEMPDSEGKQIRLSDYRGEKYVVLVFNRGLG
jgi:peroxiredoxin